jgi:hypothetical protein
VINQRPTRALTRTDLQKYLGTPYSVYIRVGRWLVSFGMLYSIARSLGLGASIFARVVSLASIS